MSAAANQQSTTPSRPGLPGWALALISSLGAGVATVLGKWNLESIDPLLMNCFIFTTATVALSVTHLPQKGPRAIFRQTKVGWMWILLFSITSWSAIWAFWAGVQRMDPTLAAFLNRAEVLVAILLGIIFLKERFTKSETTGAVLALAGIVIMRFTIRGEYTEGFWLVLLGAFFFGLTEFVSKIAVRHVPAVTLAYLRNMIMAVLYWVALLIIGVDFTGFSEVWYGVIALGLVGPVWSRMVYLMALEKMELSKVAVISQTQPVYVLIIALVFLSQLPTVRETIGGIFLIAGCILMIIARYREKSRARITPKA